MPTRRQLLEQFDAIFLLILAVAALLFFFRLDHRPFWQDEAETACLARNVLEYGVPKAFDGVNLVSQEFSREFNSDYIWRWSPWLQIYLTAGAFWLGGVGTMAGRLPFALFGFASVVMVFRLIKRHFQDLVWARLAALLMASSVLFLLFSRQCRYYSLGTFLTLLSLYAFKADWQKRLGPAICLILSLGLLFQTNYMLFFSYGGAMLLATLLVYRQDLPPVRTLILIICLALLVIPALGFYKIQQQTGLMDFSRTPRILACYFIDLFRFMLPLPLAALMVWGLGWGALRVAKSAYTAAERFILFLSLIILANIFILSLAPSYFFRYMIHLLPLCIIILAWTCSRVLHYHKFSGIMLILLLTLTNWLYLIPVDLSRITLYPAQSDGYMLTSANLPLRLYLTELLADYPDVNKGLVDFFQTRAKPGDTILTNYGDLPLQFYTQRKVVGGLQGRAVLLKTNPPWVVKLRTYSFKSAADHFIEAELPLQTDYEAIILPYPDDRFGNRPDPGYHHFIPPPEPYDHLVVFRKRIVNLSKGQ